MINLNDKRLLIKNAYLWEESSQNSSFLFRIVVISPSPSDGGRERNLELQESINWNAKSVRFLGSWVEFKVAGFFVFSHIRIIGYFRLGKG